MKAMANVFRRSCGLDDGRLHTRLGAPVSARFPALQATVDVITAPLQRRFKGENLRKSLGVGRTVAAVYSGHPLRMVTEANQDHGY